MIFKFCYDLTTNPKFFPTLMIILSFLAAINYAVKDITDWRHIIYFICGGILTICVTY